MVCSHDVPNKLHVSNICSFCTQGTNLPLMLQIGTVRTVGQLSMQSSIAPRQILEAFQKAGKTDMVIYCKIKAQALYVMLDYVKLNILLQILCC